MFAASKCYQSNYQHFRPTDVFLASYPRSGNTWMRLLLSDLLLQHHGIHPDQIHNVIPDAYKADIAQWDQNPITAKVDRLIKTHEPYDPAYDRIIYLVRHPADCLNSYFHYWSVLRLQRSQPELDPVEFYQTHLPQWVQHVESYLQVNSTEPPSAATPPSLLQFVSYEDLHSQPVPVLHHLATLLKLSVSPEQIQQAIDRHAFDQVKQQAIDHSTEKLGFWEDIPMTEFFRQGQIGSTLPELPTSVIEQLETAVECIYKQARCLCRYD